MTTLLRKTEFLQFESASTLPQNVLFWTRTPPFAPQSAVRVTDREAVPDLPHGAELVVLDHHVVDLRGIVVVERVGDQQARLAVPDVAVLDRQIPRRERLDRIRVRVARSVPEDVVDRDVVDRHVIRGCERPTVRAQPGDHEPVLRPTGGESGADRIGADLPVLERHPRRPDMAVRTRGSSGRRRRACRTGTDSTRRLPSQSHPR